MDEKEQDLQKPLLEHAVLDRLIGLVINREVHLNPHLVRDMYEKFIRTTHIRVLFYR